MCVGGVLYGGVGEEYQCVCVCVCGGGLVWGM